MYVRLKEKWMGNSPGMLLGLSDIKANDLISRKVAEAVTLEQVKVEMDKKQKMQQEYRNKMVTSSKETVKEPDKESEKEKEPEKPPEKKIELKIRQPAANK